MPIETINCDTKRNILSNGLTIWSDEGNWDDSLIWDEIHLNFDTNREIVSYIVASFLCDTQRIVLSSLSLLANSQRSIKNTVEFNSDSLRELFANVVISTDLLRSIYANILITNDTNRKLLNNIIHNLNTERKILNTDLVSCDLDRLIRISSSILFDTLRIIEQTGVTVIYADLLRIIRNDVEIQSDLIRSVNNLTNIDNDLLRHVQIKDINNLDTYRRLFNSISNQYDFLRKILNDNTIVFDTIRKILSTNIITSDILRKTLKNVLINVDTLRKIIGLFNKLKLQGEFNQKIKLSGEFVKILNMYGDFIINTLLHGEILNIKLEARFDYIVKLKVGGNMAKTNQDFEMYQKTDKIIEFTIRDNNNNPKDLTGSRAFWMLSGGLSGNSRIIKSIGNGITINGNKVSVIIEDIDTADLSGKFNHELRIIDSNDIDEVVAVGSVTIIPSKTKDLGD